MPDTPVTWLTTAALGSPALSGTLSASWTPSLALPAQAHPPQDSTHGQGETPAQRSGRWLSGPGRKHDRLSLDVAVRPSHRPEEERHSGPRILGRPGDEGNEISGVLTGKGVIKNRN